MLDRIVEEKEIETRTVFANDNNEQRLISYYKSDYSFRMVSLLIAMKNIKSHIEFIGAEERINIHIAQQYLLINLDDKNAKWIEVRPNNMQTRLSMRACNLQLGNTLEYCDDIVDIKTKEYTNVQELLDFIVDAVAKSMVESA